MLIIAAILINMPPDGPAYHRECHKSSNTHTAQVYTHTLTSICSEKKSPERLLAMQHNFSNSSTCVAWRGKRCENPVVRRHMICTHTLPNNDRPSAITAWRLQTFAGFHPVRHGYLLLLACRPSIIACLFLNTLYNALFCAQFAFRCYFMTCFIKSCI